MTPYVGSAQMRVLGLVLDGQRRGLPPTLREIAGRMGCGLTNVALRVDQLALKGLVGWEDNQRRTLRPTCRFIPAEQLGEEGRA